MIFIHVHWSLEGIYIIYTNIINIIFTRSQHINIIFIEFLVQIFTYNYIVLTWLCKYFSFLLQELKPNIKELSNPNQTWNQY